MSFGIRPFNPASPNRSGSLSGSISSHSSTNSSSLFGPFLPTDTSSIESLSARYASVKSLKENFDRTQEQLCQANSFATELLKDLQRLRDEKKQLTTTDSMQQQWAELVSVLSAPSKPVKRPDDLPFSVLWSFDDVRLDPDASPKVNNLSRPSWQLICRNADGSLFNEEALAKVESTIATVYSAQLAHFPGPDAGRPATFTYLKMRYPKEMRASVDEVERLIIALGLCAHSWKVHYLFQHHIQNKTNAVVKQRNKKGKATAPAASPSVHPTPTPPGESPSAIAAGLPPPGTSESSPKRKASNDSASGTLSDDRPTKKAKNDRTTDPSSVFSAAFTLGTSGNPPHLSSEHTAIDVSLIRVDPALDNLQEIFSSEFPGIEFSNELLTQLGLLSPLDSDIATPSSDALAFVIRIETADPNTPGLSEDNDNEQWGHHQFTGGEMSIDATLNHWGAVATTSFACRLLAASVKTCRVARHLCFHRKRTPTGSYLSDIYLGRVVGKLWELVKDLTPPNGSVGSALGNTQPGSVDEAVRTRVATLQVVQLNKWISIKNISRGSLNQKPKKADLVELILASDSIPSEEDMPALALARRPPAKKT